MRVRYVKRTEYIVTVLLYRHKLQVKDKNVVFIELILA